MVYLVTYVLHGPDHTDFFRPAPNYAAVEDAVRNISGIYMHLGGGRWFVETQMSSQHISETLAPLTYVGDQILVFRVQNDWHAYGLTAVQVQWLRERNYSSLWEILAKLAPLPIPKSISNPFNAASAALNAVRRIQ